MDTTAFLLTLFKQLWWLAPLFVLTAILKSPAVKGWFGEKRLERRAARRLPAHAYRAFHNVTIPDGSATTQIDHVYVSRYGIFVIETKNYKGWIFGSQRDRSWTQSIYGRKKTFQNPLRQNHKHTMTLADMLGMAHSLIHSVVVFTGESKFKTPLPDNVRTLHDFDSHILSFTQPRLTEQDVERICRAIESARLAPGRATNRAHRRNLRKRHGRGLPP
ncbi:nuclease-related domain-containing protein [Luteimonas sp. e5]